ncbi:MAG: RNA degradosome polyphosphate kinase [Campylobacterales bacterium]|nr:RNA degradosome polyphosphate kinase [Campylobacterales bacterium]
MMEKRMEKDLKEPSLYINRELSWLRFNTRVLEEAQNARHPLLERLKFLAIYGTNLDEFYMIRAAGLQEMFKMGINAVGADKMTPIGQLSAIREYTHKEKLAVEAAYKEIVGLLAREELFVKKYSELNDEMQKKADTYFFSSLYPVIIPIAIDATHPFPHLNNLSFGLAVKLLDKEDKHTVKFGLIRIPRVLNRFVEISTGVFVGVESIVRRHIENLFVGYEPIESVAFRVTRNADLVIEEEEAEDFLELLEQGIRARRKGDFVRITLEHTDDKELYDFLISHVKVDDGDIYKYAALPLDPGSLWQIVSSKRFAHLTYKPYTPKVLPPLDLNGNIFDQIEKQDIVFFQPYESFDPVVKFISDAAKDSEVLSIKMTLYRVGKNSPLVKALIEAAENGIQVTALVELKARFDEENNLHWARALERAGAHVVYGISGLKVHAKIATVVRKHRDGLKQYVHLSTGNYNVQSARIYTDVGFFTANNEIAQDATKFFHHLTGSAKYSELKMLSMAPTQMKDKILALIDNETKHGANGQIIAKMNAVVDADVIRALYRASMAGVKIELIVRGICCLRPGISGISDNITVTSIVGKYLEHARIFYFKNSTPQLYFSSADWMTRNLEKRIELLTPVSDAKIAQKLLEILKLQVGDDVQARILGVDGEYTKIESKNGGLDSQKILEDYVSGVYESHMKEQGTKENKLASKLLKES